MPATRSRRRSPSPVASPDIATLKVADLRARLQDLGLSTQGRKAELQDRLAGARGYEIGPPAPPRPGATSSRGPPPSPPVDTLGSAQLEARLAEKGLSIEGTEEQKQDRLLAFYSAQSARVSFRDGGGATGFEAQIGGIEPRVAARGAPSGAFSVVDVARGLSGSAPTRTPGSGPRLGRSASAASAATPRNLSASFAPPGSADSFASAASRIDASFGPPSAGQASEEEDSEDEDDAPAAAAPGPADGGLADAAEAIREAALEMRRTGNKRLTAQQLPIARANEERFPLVAREVADGRFSVQVLASSRQAQRLEVYLAQEANRKRRAGRDFDAEFSVRQAAPAAGEAAILAAHTDPGPVPGVRVWRRPEYAAVNFMEQESNA
jgi:hypothetical protein